MTKIKLFKASSFYDQYLNYFYNKNKPNEEKSYHELLEDLFCDSFGWSDTIKLNLEKNNKFHVEEAVLNCPWIQDRWALENGVSIDKDNKAWHLEVLKEQILQFKERPAQSCISCLRAIK